MRDLFQDWDPMVVRLYILRSHYRSPLDFSSEGLSGAKSALERLVSFRSRLGSPASGEPTPGTEVLVRDTENAFLAAMDDDLNTPGALAAVFDFVRAGNIILEGGNVPEGDRYLLASFMDRLVTGILGIRLEQEAGGSSEDLCRILGEVRGYLRKNRLFEEADRMRRTG